ncbi:hypothetical protein OH799_00565 [Nocardia sp. NBC_00881]|uniref:hypothetical protein n=1 Tax=Nocardia sp. NBC_00881 TaxID=2975995 RepID=UPI00386DF14A|nr:hypothetical protein OH799_00565 [Nocardia sp. NBC_00881]
MPRPLSRRDLLKIGSGAMVAGAVLPLVRSTVAPDLAHAAGWHSQLVYPDANGRLVYKEDPRGKTIPDFSWAGYRNAEVPLPSVPVVKEIGPISGDNTAHIQAALDDVGAMPLGANGFRGALRLAAGHYKVAGTIVMQHDGVVLRGAGQWDDDSTNTVITGTGGGSATEVLRVGGPDGNWRSKVPGTETGITSSLVKAGENRMTLASTANLKVGDNIIIDHPHTQEWTDAIKGGGVIKDAPWKPNTKPIMYNRYVKEIVGNDIVICAPVFNNLRRSQSQCSVWVWNRKGLVRNVGVENLRIDMGDPSEFSEDHPQNCVHINWTEDAWVKDATLLHFSRAAVAVTHSSRVTVQGVRAREPRSVVEGRKRYSFSANIYAQQVLFRDVEANKARHAFIAAGMSTCSGNVWLNGTSEDGLNESGGHNGWSQGLLYDNVKELRSRNKWDWVLSLHNRGDKGNGEGHGWSSVHSVAWNCTVDNGKKVCVQAPPTSQNFAIGTTGAVTGENWYTGSEAGYEEGTNRPGLVPGSLYEAQLADRLRNT